MTPAARAARLEYLRDTPAALRHAAPTVASVLAAQYNQLAPGETHKPKSAQARRREVCLACGRLFGPERHASDAAEPDEPASLTPISKAARRRQKAKKLAVRKSLHAPTLAPPQGSGANGEDLTCERCHRITYLRPSSNSAVTTNQQDKHRALAHLQNSAPELASPAVSNQAGPGRAAAISNSNSKKRAKARKQGGLQAILAKNKVRHSDANPAALDLMDFMSND